MSHMGADLEQLATLRASLLQQAQVIEQLSSTVRQQLGTTTWHGPAADRFRAAWGSDFEPSLRRLQAAMQEAGMEVGRRRDALLQAGG
ncbi:MAG TPA: WXG100 family type VII secretion target [Baekduia sp.]|nr:WXG100 family type VII secretion target [Baekduia sp.]